MQRATWDPSLDWRVNSRRSLLYSAGPDVALDRPGHVRAASGLAHLGDGRWAVVQDDALFLAFIEPTGEVTSLALPAGAEGVRLFDAGRGNKKKKLDLEAAVVIDGALVAFGSGSLEARERVVVARGAEVKVVDAHGLYAALQSERDFAGSEMNIEGAALVGQDVVLASRGNGAARNGLEPIDAICKLDARALMTWLEGEGRGAPPRVRDVVRFDLGQVEGARLTFTDLTTHAGALFYSACAELSPNAIDDGPVVGVAIGTIGERARFGFVRDEAGALLTCKIEGISFAADDVIHAVVDVDDPDRAAEMLVLARVLPC